uniref:DCD domain-containing protein n=1 Tax=Populus trichocarpa TaxID=3694 RepID=A0A2K2ABB9_POPTR
MAPFLPINRHREREQNESESRAKDVRNVGEKHHRSEFTTKGTPKSLRAKSKTIEKPSANNSLKSKKAKSSPKSQGRNRKKNKDIIQGKGERNRNEHGDANNLNSSEKNENLMRNKRMDGMRRRKKRLGGMIFMCSAKTKPDCFLYRVMGITMNKKELILASSAGGVKLEADFSFVALLEFQVRFVVHKDCFPITESVFKKAMKDNYNEKNKFKTELTVPQVLKLSALFRPVIGPVHSPPMVTVQDREVYAGARDLLVHLEREAFAIANLRYSMLRHTGDQHVSFNLGGSMHRDEFSCDDLFMSEKEYRTYSLSGDRRKLTPSHHIPSTLDPYQRDQEREHLLRQPDPIYRDTVPLQREAVLVVPLYLNQPYNSSDAYVPPPRRDELSSGSYYVDGCR